MSTNVYATTIRSLNDLIGAVFVFSNDCRGGGPFAYAATQNSTYGTYQMIRLIARQKQPLTMYNNRGYIISGSVIWDGERVVLVSAPGATTLSMTATVPCTLMESDAFWILQLPIQASFSEISSFLGLLGTQTVSSNYRMSSSDRMVYADASKGKFTITLPKKYPANTPLTIQRVDHGYGRLPIVNSGHNVHKLDTCNCHNSVVLYRRKGKWVR